MQPTRSDRAGAVPGRLSCSGAARCLLLVAVVLAFAISSLRADDNVPVTAARRAKVERTGNKWSDMDYGPYLSASIEAPQPEGNIANKGLMICVDPDSNAHVVFDTDLLRYSAGWTGGKLNWTSVVYDGSHNTHPTIAGSQVWGNRVQPGWAHEGSFADPRSLPHGPLPRAWGRYQGLYLHENQVVLSYHVGNTAVLELPGYERHHELAAFTRTVEIGPSTTELIFQVTEQPGTTASLLARDTRQPSPAGASLRDTIAVLGDLDSAPAPQRAEPAELQNNQSVAYWSFDRAAAQRGRSFDGNRSLELRGAEWDQGKQGSGLKCNERGYALVPDVAGLQLGERDYSISAWIKTSGGGTIVSMTSAGRWVPGGKTLFVRGGKLCFDIGWVGKVSSSRPLADGAWHHVALTHQQTGRVQLYIDGVPDGHGALKSLPDPADRQLRLGFTADDFPEAGNNRLRGTLDDVALFTRVLTPAEVQSLAGVTAERELTAVAAIGAPPGMEWIAADGSIRVKVPAGNASRTCKLLIWKGPAEALRQFTAAIGNSPPPVKLAALTNGGPPRWSEKLTTQGTHGADQGPYTVDTITVPMQNPWNSWMRPGGFDFFSDGRRAAVCTWNGDVWIVDGIHGELENLVWQRIATGLFQPLGLKIVDDRIYVCCRDQIARLHDLNGDEEIDYYESFNSDHQVTPHFHEFAVGLQTDPDGNFYYAKCARHALDAMVPQHGTLIKVSADGQQTEILCNGFRAANGVGLGPRGEWITSDQEGHWVPANRINQLRRGGFYGNMWSFHTGERPTSYDPPLCWVPAQADRSPAEQFWVTSDQWGPLQGALLSTSYGTGQIFLVLQDTASDVPQGGLVPFGLNFPTGIMRGRFHPTNGQLYTCGLFGWAGDKTLDGAFYRVRYTGQPVHMPHQWHVAADGITITFTEPLDRRSAEDPRNYHLEQWNYRWTGNYGSAHYRVTDPAREGHDPVEVLAAALSDDGRTVALRIKDLRPVMQLRIGYTLTTADGTPLKHDIYATINRLGKTSLGPLSAPDSPLAESTLPADLRPGLKLALQQNVNGQPTRDARIARLAALLVERDQPASPFLRPGPFQATFTGYLQLPLNGRYTFDARGTGSVTLRINGQPVLQKQLDQPANDSSSTIALSQGYNQLEVQYHSPEQQDAALRIIWSGDGFDAEPLPPDALFTVDDAELATATTLRRGRELLATRGCLNCHALPAELADVQLAMPEAHHGAPALTQSGHRFSADWLYHWILNPQALRPDAVMPRLLHGDHPALARQQAADLAAYLVAARSTADEAIPAIDDQTPAQDLIDEGERTFENLGCIACHHLQEPSTNDEHGRLSLHYASKKYQPQALEAYLLAPHRHHASSRMPDFRLSDPEAKALAAYLSARTDTAALPAGERPAGNAERGRGLFQSVGCANCHTLGDETFAKRRLPPLTQSSGLAGGCLADPGKATPAVPDFALSETDRAAIRAFLGGGLQSLLADSPAEFAERQITALRCNACHRRDARDSVLPLVLAEEGSQGHPPELLPNLAWAGEKLKPQWTAELLAGKSSRRARGWLKARMPAFPAHAQHLAAGLAAVHGMPPQAEPTSQPDEKRAATGRTLVGDRGGFACNRCHAVGDTPAVAAFESPGINLADASRRLQHDYYRRWMRDPLRVDPATKMPRFTSDGRSTSVQQVLDGDAHRQFEAIWHYLQTLAAENE